MPDVSASPMPRATFDCEALTPLFVAGAHQDGPPELRGASIRGALRYWYRALLGGRGTTGRDQLKEKEAEVFGSTDRASPVRVRLLPYGVDQSDRKKSVEISNLNDPGTGTRYLWYFTHPTLKEKSKYDPSEDRRYIVPGACFEVQLLARPGREEALREATRAFWLLTHLGGLGLRCRRMAGAFDADLVASPEGLALPSFDAPWDYDDWFTAHLKRFGAGSTAPTRPAFDSLTARHAKVRRLSVKKNSYEGLVEHIGGKFKKYREGFDVPEKVGLGLPMVTPRDADPIDVTQSGSPIDRRASPLWLQVIRGPDDTLGAVTTYMESQFGPDGDRVRVSWEGGEKPVDDPFDKLGEFARDKNFGPTRLLPGQ